MWVSVPLQLIAANEILHQTLDINKQVKSTQIIDDENVKSKKNRSKLCSRYSMCSNFDIHNDMFHQAHLFFVQRIKTCLINHSMHSLQPFLFQ